MGVAASASFSFSAAAHLPQSMMLDHHCPDPSPAICKRNICSHGCKALQSWSQIDCKSQMWGRWLVVRVLRCKEGAEWYKVEGKDLVTLEAQPVTL